MRFLLILFLFLLSCESFDDNGRTINSQGLMIDDELYLTEQGLRLDSVSYSTGFKQFILKGEFSSRDSLVKYILYLSGNPLRDHFDILSHSFPLRNIDAKEDYTCQLKIEKNRCEVLWINDKSRLFIRECIIEGH